MKATKRDLVGRRIAAVDFRRFASDPELSKRKDATDPLIILDNGRALYFATQETEIGEYGVAIHITPPVKQSRRLQ